jgi:adenylylsulfate kinase
MTCNNLTWFGGYITRAERETLHGHKGAVVWFTGLSASGKSTIAHYLEKKHYRRGGQEVVNLLEHARIIPRRE